MKKEISKEISKNIPEGVRVISVISFVLVGILLLAGIGFVNFGESFSKMADADKATLAQQGISLPGSSTLVSIGILFLIIGVLFYFVGRDLLCGKKWAMMVIVILSIIFLILALWSLIQGRFSSIISVVIEGLIIWYLIIRKETKTFFN